MNRPLALDLCSGLGGFAEGLEVEGWDVIRVDIVDMFAATGTPKPPNCLLMVQDIRTFHGSQAKQCSLIVASPPCQEFSWMAMPWSLAKAHQASILADDSGHERARLTELFDACFRIQREACEAAGRHIPMIVENVRGAQKWVGRARWNYGSFYFWGDIPALMPSANVRKVLGFRFDGRGTSFQSAAVEHTGIKASGMNWSDQTKRGQDFTRLAGNHAKNSVSEGRKGAGAGAEWFDNNLCKLSSKSNSRKMASAMIAKIPLPVSRHIGRTFYPSPESERITK